MNSSFRGGAVAGFILGAALMALATLLLRSRTAPQPTEAVAVAASSLREVELNDQNVKLKAKIADLEQAMAAKPAPAPKKEKPAPDKPEAEKPAVDYHDLFAKLSEAGLAAFQSPRFKETVEAVKAAGKPALEFLMNNLRTSKSATERFIAAALLEGAADPSSVDALAFALKGDSDDIVRRMASHALAVLGTPAAETALRSASVDDSDWGVRVNSAYGLAKLNNEDGLKLLKDAYESTDTPPEYRLAILGGLADVAAPSTAPLFRRILADTKDASYLLMSIGALEKMKDSESIPSLQRIVESAQPQMVKQAATRAIESIKK